MCVNSSCVNSPSITLKVALFKLVEWSNVSLFNGLEHLGLSSFVCSLISPSPLPFGEFLTSLISERLFYFLSASLFMMI